MKIHTNKTPRFALAAVLAGLLSAGGLAFAQESTTYAPDPADTSGTKAPKTAQQEEEGPPKGTSSMAGVGQKPRKSDAAKTNPTATAQMGGAAMADMDRQFMQTAAKDGMKEVHMGQMAAQQGKSDAVKKLGSKIVADHTKANQQLMAIATKKGVKLDTDHKMAKMSKRDMANFDQAWLGMMVNDHQKDIAAYDKQAKMGADPELKAYAKKTLPVLKSHLKMVEAAQKKMGSTMTAPPKQADAGSATAKTGR